MWWFWRHYVNENLSFFFSFFNKLRPVGSHIKLSVMLVSHSYLIFSVFVHAVPVLREDPVVVVVLKTGLSSGPRFFQLWSVNPITSLLHEDTQSCADQTKSERPFFFAPLALASLHLFDIRFQQQISTCLKILSSKTKVVTSVPSEWIQNSPLIVPSSWNFNLTPDSKSTTSSNLFPLNHEGTEL